MARQLDNIAGAARLPQNGAARYTVIDPADGTTALAEFAGSSNADVALAVKAAHNAFGAWKNTPVVKRCRTLFHYKELLEQKSAAIAEMIVRENGKLLSEAEGELRRGIEVVEFAAGMPSLMKGDFIENISANIDGYIYREPLGVVAGACPFNFPVMIPLWMFPIAIACGNTFVLKPSEKCPLSAAYVIELALEAGVPEGVLNVVHGGRETFEALIDNQDVRAISFVGSTPAAKNVWERAGAMGKRVQSLGGAKNYIIVMPDADPSETVKAIVSSSFGCAGERCMASSIALFVGDAQHMLDDVVAAARGLVLGNGLDKQSGMGPVISAEHKARVEKYIAIGTDEGATLLLDGRGKKVKDLPNGFFIGPTIFSKVTTSMRIAKEEIFGPVLCAMSAPDLDRALAMANSSAYGNGASIFTSSGSAARRFRSDIECGMLGINTGVPAPMAFFSFGGHKGSFFGDLRAHGPDGIEFYTKKKTVIDRWPDSGNTGNIWGK